MNFSVLYSLTYGGTVRYSDLNALSHSLSVNASRQLGRKWSFTVAGTAQDNTMAQYLCSADRAECAFAIAGHV